MRMVYRCRAQTDDGTLCKRRVNGPDVRCFQHPGQPAGRVTAPRKRPVKRVQPVRQVPRQPTTPRLATRTQRRPQPPAQAAREHQRAEKATQLCLDLLESGGTALIAERASAYVADETWKTLVRRHRRTGCDDLAELARNILNGTDRLHEAFGRAAGRVFGWLGRPPIERVFAQELARRIPLPVGAQLAAAARGLQIAGIYVCIVGSGGLADCACLQDLLRFEGTERLQLLVQGGMQDWQELPRRMRDAATGS